MLTCLTHTILGLFPDAAVILKVDEKDVISRILPNKMAIWIRKRDKRLAIRKAKKDMRIKEWVRLTYMMLCWFVYFLMQEDDKAKRKAEITEEYEAQKTRRIAEREEAREADESEDEAEDVETLEAEEEYKQQTEEIDEEEFEDEEEEEEEETEEEARERMKTELSENCDEQTQSIEGLQVSMKQILHNSTDLLFKPCCV